MRTLTLATALLLSTWPLAAYAAPADPSPPPARAAALCHGFEVTIPGTPSADVLTGTPGRDVIRGYDGFDVIDGGGGNDVICGGRGKDTISGGTGNDWLGGGRREDVLRGGPGSDRLSGGVLRSDRMSGDAGDDTYMVESSMFGGSADALDYTQSPAGIVADLGAGTVTGWGSDTIREVGEDPVLHYPKVLGSEFDDQLIGGPGTQRLYGNGGDDVLRGNRWEDDLWPGLGANTVEAGDRSDTITLQPDDLPDVVHAGPGQDFIYRIGLHDQVYGGDELDVLTGTTQFADDQVIDAGDADQPYARNKLDLMVLAPSETQLWHQVTLDLAASTLTADDHVLPLPGARVVTITEPLAPAQPIWKPVAQADSYLALGTTGPEAYYFGADVFSFGVAGPVTVYGYGGDDQIRTGWGDDTIDAGDGSDLVGAGEGYDTCVSVEGSLYGPGQATGCDVSSP